VIAAVSGICRCREVMHHTNSLSLPLSVMRKFECKWKACHAPETDTLEAVQGHIKAHCSMASDGKCQWSTCFYAVHDSVVGESSRILDLQLHTLTHLPESDEQIEARERLEKERYREEDLMMTKALKSQEIRPAIMTNGARYISGPTALMPNSTFAAEKRRIELDRVEVKRRKLLNTPVRGTVDMPDILVFSVTRTPMDPDTSKPTGISSTSGLILRSLARTTATILIKAGVREKRKLPENKASQSGQYERFGLPLPVSSAAEVDVKADLPESGVDGNGATAGTGGIGPVEDWALQAASRIMDALLDVEDQIMAVASENDILCPMLNETLVELKPEPGESIWTEPEDESSL
jgi:chromatin structure-remodeling complex subunit RSC9